MIGVNKKYFWPSKIHMYKYSNGALSRQRLQTSVIPHQEQIWGKQNSGYIEAVRRDQLLYNHGLAGLVAGSDYHHPPAAAAAMPAVAAHFDLSKQQNQVSGRKLLAFELFKFFLLVFLQAI